MNLQNLLSNTSSDRNALKPNFNTGEIPTQTDFHTLIDGLFRLRDDSIYKDADNGLCIKAGTDADKTALLLYDDFNDPKWTIAVNNGFHIKDSTGNNRVSIRNNNSMSIRSFTISLDGQLTIKDDNNAGVIYFPSTGNYPNLYIRSGDSSGYDERVFISGATGNVGIGASSPDNLRGKLHVNGNIYFGNNALISHVDPNNPTTNIDHIWHDDSGLGTWHFVSDSSYKANGNSRIQAGSIHLGPGGDRLEVDTAGEVFVKKGWLRVEGDKGIYFQDHGGGFRMTDNTWIRTYGNKSFYHNAGIMRTDGQLQVGPNGNRFIVKTNGDVAISGDIEVQKKIIIKSGASNANASTMLNSMGNQELIIGGVYQNTLYFYWKNHQGQKRRATIQGTPFSA